MNDYKKSSRFAGRSDKPGGFSRGGRPSFGAPRGGRDEGGEREQFDATCAKCGDACQVPFRPNGKKPVYCRNCFVKDEAPQAEGGYRERSFGGDRPSFIPPQRSERPAEDPRMGSVLKELSSVNSKLDTLITLIGASVRNTPSAPAEAKLYVSDAKPKKISKKKAA